MLLKTDVKTEGVQLPIMYALGVFEALYYKEGYELTVTSLLDGKHSDNSLHYKGLAADLRIDGVPSNKILEVCNDARALLYKLGFDVVIEVDHIHVEYDPKPGRSEYMLKHA